MIETFQPTEEDPRMIPLVPAIGDDDHGLLAYYSQLWHEWIPTNQQRSFQAGGYFAVDVTTNLRVLSLNTLYFYKKNKQVHGCHRDGLAKQHMDWFKQQLIKAKQEDNTQIYIMGHVPPSPRDYRRTCFQEYTRLATQYQDIIKGQFFGHLNMDHFLLYNYEQVSNISPSSSSPHLQQLGLPNYTAQELTMFGNHNITNQDDDKDVICINRNIGKYVDWLYDMYAAIELPEKDEISPGNGDGGDDQGQDPSSLMVIQVSPSVLPVYLPTLRIYRYEINENQHNHQVIQDQKGNRDQKHHSNNNNKKLSTSSSLPYGTLLGYDQYYANITEWDQVNAFKNTPLEYQLEYTTEEAYGLSDLTVQSYYNLAKDLVDGDTFSEKLWSNYIKNMFVQTYDHEDINSNN
ncbi:unnamed protein product [Cunninghamella echinulata]